MARTVLLISMPWDALNYPSIRLGILRSLLEERAGISTDTRSFNLELMNHFAADRTPGAPRILVEDYEKVAEMYTRRGVGEWIFSVPPFRSPEEAADHAYFAHLRERDWMPEAMLPKLLRMRELVPSFLDHCLEDVLKARPRVVGFTTSFSQNVPSLVLAKMVKKADPSIKIVFGGANCESTMGEALHRSYPFIDVVVRGEAEGVLIQLMNELLDGERPSPQPGLCIRGGDEILVVPESGGTSPRMEDVPMPNYDEYFARLRRSRIRGEIQPKVKIPFESARGCWWGEKSHCTFCGLNGSAMRFRSKGPEDVLGQILKLATRHQWLDFVAVDNIIDMRYFKNILPELRDRRLDVRIFYETKSNLKKHQVRMLRDAGVRMIQPGIESLSTPILKLMKKGVTALQNLRLLKWASQYGVRINWNILYGFPGEPPEEYGRMAEVMRSLHHLQPPFIGRLLIERFSPYFVRPEELGFKNLRPVPHYRHIYGLDSDTLNDLAYDFAGDYADGRDPEAYIGPLREAVADWFKHASASYGKLRYRRGDGFLIIHDGRTNLRSAVYTLDEVESKIYLACDVGASPATIFDKLHGATRGLSVGAIRRTLDDLMECKLLYEENGRYLSLAIPTNPDEDTLLEQETDEEDEDEGSAGWPESRTLIQVRRSA